MMQLLKKRHHNIVNFNDKLSIWEKELESNISKTFYNFKELLFYIVLKSWMNKPQSAKNLLPDINYSKKNSSLTLNPDNDFFVVNKTTWYSLKGKLKLKHNPIRKIGHFCNKKLVFLFDSFCYFFYKDKYLDYNKIYEGYLSFNSKQNVEKLVFLLKYSEINFFFDKINANSDLYKQILYYKGTTFELVLKNNINKSTLYRNNYLLNNINKSEKKQKKSEVNSRDDSIKITKLNLYNDYDKGINSARYYERNSNPNNRIILYRGNSCINIKNKSLDSSLDISPRHFPDRKLSKKEDEKLNKILKAVIYYYNFNKIFFRLLNDEQEQEFIDISLCMINKDWLNFFINKYYFNEIKQFLDIKFDEIDPLKYLEYKEILIEYCNIKDFLLIQSQPIKPLEKEYTEFGQEYYENYELINKNLYYIFKEVFGSYELNEVKEYKINFLKKRGIIINYNPNQIEVTKMYMESNKNNKRPEKYLIVLTNNKYMNFRIKRPLEENGIDEGLKLIPKEQNAEDDEEYFKIKINNNIIGNLINITNSINKTLGNFIPTKPCLKGIEKNGNIYCINSVIQCLCNIPFLLGYFLNKKRMRQMNIQIENNIISYNLMEIFKDLWLNEEIKVASTKKLSNCLLEMNPFFSGKENNVKELLYYIINMIHQELNKIGKLSEYRPNNKIKFNYQLIFENYFNFFKSNYKSIISEIFYGFKNDTITCSNCSATSHSINFYDIMIFPTDKVRLFKGYSKDKILIEECFEYNERKIKLYNSQNYLCDFCNRNANGTSIVKLISIPKVLILAFDRQEEKDFNVKVIYDEFINLRKFVFCDSNNFKYELCGVIKNMNVFHEDKKYVSFCKSFADKMWYLYNDENVVKTDFNRVKDGGNVNILIYNCVSYK